LLNFDHNYHRDSVLSLATGVARNFDWEGPKMKKICDVNLVTFFGDVVAITSLKWRHNWFFKVRFRHWNNTIWPNHATSGINV